MYLFLKQIIQKVFGNNSKILLFLKKVKRKSYLPFYYIIYFKYRYKVKHLKKVDRVLNVLFLVIHHSVWKYEVLYKLMKNHKAFNPIVLVIPNIGFDNDTMIKDMNSTFSFFKEKGYNVLKSYNESLSSWISIKEMKPDLIMFTNPYSGLTKPEYFVNKLTNYLTYYIPYAYNHEERHELNFNQKMHNLVFCYVVESEFHKKLACKYSDVNGINVKPLGYPGIDELLFPKIPILPSSWKTSNKKRIIWAPHHTIEPEENIYNYSNFLEYAPIMIELAKAFQNHLEISFKPHPLLKPKLYKTPSWGVEKTDEYYHIWGNMPNGHVNESDYIDLFLTSDAIIHDSGSFLVEYLCVNKPALYQIRNIKIKDGLGEIGKQALDCHYKAYSKDDVINFIDNVVLKETDELKINREAFVKQFLSPLNNKCASENIMEDICKTLNISYFFRC